MSLYQEWEKLASQERNQNEYQTFWTSYFEKEKQIYQGILSNHKELISGTFTQLVERFEIDKLWMVGFIDGINTSLKKEIEVDKLEENSQITLAIDFEKLLFNMHNAKAEWLYNLEEWDNVISKERRTEIEKEFKKSQIAVSEKIGRNDPCSCGSGKKYKKCCGNK